MRDHQDRRRGRGHGVAVASGDVDSRAIAPRRAARLGLDRPPAWDASSPRVIEGGSLRAVEQDRLCLLNPAGASEAAFEQFLELAISKELFDLRGITQLQLSVALWHGGLPVDVLPAEGTLQVALGEEHLAWPTEPLAP